MTYKETLDALIVALSRPEAKTALRECVERLITNEFVQLVDVTFNGSVATVSEGRIVLEPSDLFRKLLAAAQANDVDAASAIECDALAFPLRG